MTHQRDGKREELQSIVAMLFSFACMAFGASMASDAKRRLTLWTLRPALACACDRIVGIPIDRRAYALTGSIDDASPEDAVHLAQTFCVLAVLHHYLLARRGIGREDLRAMPGPALPLTTPAAQPSSGGGGCVRDVSGCCAKLN